MGKALVIILAGMVIAVGFTFMGISSQRESMRQRNVNTFYSSQVTNMAHTGIQMAINKYNEDPDKEEFADYPTTVEGVNLVLTLEEVPTDMIRITSTATFNGVEAKVIYTFDISKVQSIIPNFPGALTDVGNGNLKFEESNNKVHFNGNPPAGTNCPEKPGLIVSDADEVDNYTDNETISGNPDVDSSDDYKDPIKYEEIAKIIESLAPYATSVDSDEDFTNEPQVYFIDDIVHLSGQTEGWGILVVRNDAILDIDADFDASGQFTFHGLIIFLNETNFSGTGKAIFDGSVIAASNNNSTFNIKANGNFVAQFNCTAKQYADSAVNKALNTTIYQVLSVYEK